MKWRPLAIPEYTCQVQSDRVKKLSRRRSREPANSEANEHIWLSQYRWTWPHLKEPYDEKCAEVLAHSVRLAARFGCRMLPGRSGREQTGRRAAETGHHQGHLRRPAQR